MNAILYPETEAQVKLLDATAASQLIEDVLSDDGDENFVYVNVMVPPSQKTLLKELSKQNRTKQAAVFRSIIYEWCEMKRAQREA
jgi:hypothetical protein